MSATNSYPRGLTRIIFESLVALTPELAAEGESWSPEVLDRLEHDVHSRLAPQDGLRERLVFDMVFQRSFAEARQLLLGGAARQPATRRASGRRASSNASLHALA
ncbi:MAG: hypothetical protein LDL11_05440 [Desulfarculus sp.]|nr:hypothetical protein [Desulfarculus sp.]